MGAPSHGAPSACQRIPARAKEGTAAATGAGSGERGDRRNADVGSPAATQAAAHGHRIWTRLPKDCPEYAVSQAIMCRYVRQRMQELGLGGGWYACLKAIYEWGQEAQVDWLRRWRSWRASRASCTGSRCAAWLRATPFIGPAGTPRSSRCWRRTNWRSPTSSECSARVATTYQG